MDQSERWDELSDFPNFEYVENKRSERRDLHAFLLLDELFPNPGHKMVSAAEHDEIYLDVELADVEKLTDDQVIELSRCGVRYDSEFECLALFV